jgi:hypothetical protein
MRKIVGLAVVPLCAGALMVPAAQAWHCTSQGEPNEHCYDLMRFKMFGYPHAYGIGGVLYMDTEAMEVPGWQNDINRVNNEMWVVMNGGGLNYIEAGQQGGGQGNNCCALHSFWAVTHNGVQHDWYDPEVAPKHTYDDHYEILSPNAAYWGVWLGGSCNGCGGLVWASNGLEGFPPYDWELTAGMEAATPEEPQNYFKDEVASVEPQAGWPWTPWETGEWPGRPEPEHAVYERCEHTCGGASQEGCPKGILLGGEHNPENRAYGNMVGSTCRFEALVEQGAEAPEEVRPYVAPTGSLLTPASGVADAVSAARASGDSEPTEITQMQASFATTAAVLGGGTIKSGPLTEEWLKSASYLTVMHGHFTALNVKAGTQAVQSTVLAIITDAHSGAVEAEYYGPSAPVSTSLEAVDGGATTAKAAISSTANEFLCNCSMPEAPPPSSIHGTTNTYPVIIGRSPLPSHFGKKRMRYSADVLEVYRRGAYGLEPGRWSSQLGLVPGVYVVAGVRHGHPCDEHRVTLNVGEKVFVKIACHG